VTDDGRIYLAPVEPTYLAQTIKATSDQHAERDPALIGDCWRTVIACLIGADDPTTVPHFVAQATSSAGYSRCGWETVRLTRLWLRERALDLVFIDRAKADELGVSYGLDVFSVRGPWLHTVVARRGEVVHDPAGDGYAMTADAGNPVCVICDPYEPDPDALVSEWEAAEAGVS
jgi:hypothetical protein